MGGKESVYAKYLKDAVFVIPTASLLSRVVAGINALPDTTSSQEKKDTLGDLYEYLLSKLNTSGTNGQFRTPRHIIDMIVMLMKPTPEDTIVDPAAGSAGFLVSASEYLRKIIMICSMYKVCVSILIKICSMDSRLITRCLESGQ